VLAWIADVIASPKHADVRRKLNAVAPADRHLFLGVTYDSPGEAVIPLSHFETTLPPSVPTLPDEITHLWVMSLVGGERVAALHGSPTVVGSMCVTIGEPSEARLMGRPT
jgi:hypothetical protein